MIHIIIGISIIAIVFIVGGFFLFGGGSGDKNQSGGLDPAPDFTFENLDGEPVSLSDFEGRVRVVNSWASWCPFCVNELPDFAGLQEEFPDIVVIAINRRESIETARTFADSLGVTDKMLFLQDPRDIFYRNLIGGFTMPETLFIDRDGNIHTHKRGFMGVEEMREITRAVLET